MKKITTLLLLLIAFISNAQLKFKDIERATGIAYTVETNSLGVMYYKTKAAFLKNTVKSNTLTANYLPVSLGADSLGNSEVSQLGAGFSSTVNIAGALFKNQSIDLTGTNSFYPGEFQALSMFVNSLRINSGGTIGSNGATPLNVNTHNGENVNFGGNINIAGLTANSLIYSNGSKDISPLSLGSGLSLTSGTLTATGSGSTTILTGTNNITVTGSAPNYTVGVSTALTNSLAANTTSINALSASKQNTLVAGSNISLSTNTISVSSSPTFTSASLVTSATLPYATAGTVPIINGSKQLVSSATTTTQLSYLDATSSIQTQLNTKDVTSTSTNTLTNKSITSPTITGVTSITGTVTAPTVSITTNDNSIATTSCVATALKGYWKNIAKDVVGGGVTSGTTNTYLNQVVIPAGTVKVGSKIRIVSKSLKTGVAGTGTQRLYISTTSGTISGATALAMQGPSTANFFGLSRSPEIIGTTNTGVLLPTFSASSDEAGAFVATYSSLNIDWTVTQYIQVSGQCANGADSMTNLSIEVSIIE